MKNLSNIDLAYEFLKKSKKAVGLMKIWQAIKSDTINHKNDENEIIADLYGEMVLDNRFALSSDGEWAVSDNKKVDNIKKKLKSQEPIKRKKQTLESQEDDDDENPEVYDDLFVEDEEDDDNTVGFYDEDEED